MQDGDRSASKVLDGAGSVCNQDVPDPFYLLDVIIYKNFSKLEFLRHGISISQGRHIFEPRITRGQVKTVKITADDPATVHADRVVCGQTPVRISIISRALHHVPPNRWEGTALPACFPLLFVFRPV